MTKDTFPMNIGGEKVRSERLLLAKVEDGKNMMSADSIRFLVLHCSATRRNQDYSVEQLHVTIRHVGCKRPKMSQRPYLRAFCKARKFHF